ncbi:hypothetical protein [Streptomyces sp. NPDC058045]|uniref:hypothetical protein n=1 Tax=Streptomyces sp. NPDC058045 TaxID=3346311 RepID=UPI0036E156BF
MTARAGERFAVTRAVSDIEALLTGPVPATGPTRSEGDPATGEWTVTTGRGFVFAPLWESESFEQRPADEWNAAQDAASAHLAALVRELDARWGAHRTVRMHVPLFRKQTGRPMPEFFQALADEDCYGDLTVWGGPLPTAAPDRRWIALSLNQSDGDAPLILIAAVTTDEITELPEEG